MPPEVEDPPIAEDAPSPTPAAALSSLLPVQQEGQATSTLAPTTATGTLAPTTATGTTIEEEARRTIADILEQATGTMTPVTATSTKPVTDTTHDANKPLSLLWAD